MNLTDPEILELNELCNAVIDDTLSDAQRTRLSSWLAASEPARQFYVRALGQSASLHSYASEMHAEAPRAMPARFPARILWLGGLLATATAVAVFFSLRPGPAEMAVTAPKPVVFVARLSAAKAITWVGGGSLQPGALLRKGQHLDLAAGYAEVTFDSGARVVLEGPTSFVINSAWDSTLRKGTLKASVPPQAIGFRVSNPSVEVTDLGTEFTMIADASGATDVLVLKGEVEAAPHDFAESDTILLKARESRRFEADGVSAVSDSAEKFARFAEPHPLERFSTGINYFHWSFDEIAGDEVPAQVGGTAQSEAGTALKIGNAGDLAAARPPSPHGRALQFDGRRQASAHVPGISGSSPRTIAFWVKVPEAAVTDAWMVSWGTGLKKLNSRPVQISWNRRPGDGSFGALRTDFGGGYAIGAQDLRDGRWHHIAVYFAPGETSDTPVQVKQYIDGRLESSRITLTPGTARAASPAAVPPAATDVVWLGCRLTGKQPERFRGELDELFIADRGLEPQEIVSLMNDNRLPVTGLAAANPF
ncbi:LamG-like jellyroll fold domain-containing protein [Opitutus sp. GAS368]|jgi:ferric-dicitrate binding protein FerR (iron transport regulator)|uniref:LamG-like jellyroll fold domain-containing protein n=1 Tax=Opitutus sp. GAS368 TaxID=1882749 RepID=UPI0008796560|nr:LamG-like jellyroll fold domain-containing protein [Opitutus sp. GAS368]SDS00587.1 FecR family protein [Opitutus sp. GAS368]